MIAVSNPIYDGNMSEFLEKAQKSLEKCELELRQLGGDALGAGNYREAEKIAQIAKIFSEYDFQSSKTPLFQETPRVAASMPVESASRMRPATQKRTRKKGTKAGYPFFEVDGNHLIKVSWSKTKKDEYIHKAPKEVLVTLIQALLKKGSKKQLVPTEKMFPLANEETQFPDYQSYLCLLWLKLNKLVIHHGREGYQLRDPKTFENRCDELWQELDA